MSVNQSLVEVSCDGPTALEPCPESLGWSDYGTAADLRKRMHEDGWTTRGPIDRCPSCTADHRHRGKPR